MLENLKNKVNCMKIESDKRKEEKRIEKEKQEAEKRKREEERREEIRRKIEERERIEKEKLEQEKARLFELSEKELLVEMIFMLKDVVKEQKALKEKVENCEGNVSLVKTDLYSLSNKVDSLSSDIDMIKYR